MQLGKQASVFAEESVGISNFFPVTSDGSSFIAMEGKKHLQGMLHLNCFI